jgi:hypothetical protein
MTQRRGGIIQIQVDGEVFDAKGSFSYNIGRPMREAIEGSDIIHGYKETPQVAFVEGEITDRDTLVLDDLVTFRDVTVMLTLANGKNIAIYNAWFAGEGTGNTEEGNIGVRFEGSSGEEIAP